VNLVETGADGRTTVNPLAFWTDAELDAYFDRHDLPRHPLQAQGYTSIGCATCTLKPRPGEDKRSGRWAGMDKTECGIHTTRNAAFAA
jgi:phosphoadenosine phosphosulfate reductase